MDQLNVTPTWTSEQESTVLEQMGLKKLYKYVDLPPQTTVMSIFQAMRTT